MLAQYRSLIISQYTRYTVKKESFKTPEIQLHTCVKCFDTPHLDVARYVFQNTNMCFNKLKMGVHMR